MKTTSRDVLLVSLALFSLSTAGCHGISVWMSTPSQPFDAADAPPPPDYAQASSWAALPTKKSRADAVPRDSGAVDAQAGAPADAFFVHPTTYFWRRHWNAPAGGCLTDAITGATLAGQASAFNGTARIYAPRYRQMTLSGFRYPELRDDALAVAYDDVRRAFLHYLVEWDAQRPVILAGHSQGSRLVERLLDEFFREGELRERLVAAYIVGARVWEGQFERDEAAVPVCSDAEQTGCLVGWRTFAEGADPSLDTNPGELADGNSLCVNPLSWEYDTTPAPASENLGAIPLPMLGGPGRVRPALTGARCSDGFLWIDPPSASGFRIAHPDGVWHAYDYALFYMNIRENARLRVERYLDRSEAAGPTATSVTR